MFGVEITDSAYVVVSMKIMTRMGTHVLEAMGDDADVRAGAALGRRTAGAGSEGRRLAVQRDQVHLALPGDPGDLVVRLRLRRQLAARQEVLLAADRQRHGPGRGLARRAHADPQADLAGGQGLPHRRRVPVGVRQDQPRHAGADHPGLEGRDARRRHRLDAVRRRRPAVRGQPGVRPVRRRAGHRLQDQPERDAHHRQGQHAVHQRRPHRRRRHLVGGHGRAAGAPDRLARQRLDAGDRTSCPATRTAGSAPRSSSARSSPTSTTTRTACRSTRSCSAAAARPPSRW